MRFLSICSGIEAASVAWGPIGWNPVAFAEIEPFPCAVLTHRYPDVPNLGDITRYAEWPDYAFDVVCGGTPCQSFSVAGLRQGLADPRGNLALVYLAIVDRYRPRWIIWENVPGVLSSGNGRDFGSFLGALVKLGYGFAYRVLDAQYVRVDGYDRAVPQRRRRVWVVGCLGDWRGAAAVLSEPESVLGHSPPRREAGAGAAGRAAWGIDSDCFDRSGEGAGGTPGERSGLGISEDIATTIRAKRPGAVAVGGNDTRGPIDVATALNAHGGPSGRLDFESETFVAEVAQTLPAGGNATGGHRQPGTSAETAASMLIAFNGSQDPAVTGNRAGTLNCMSPQDQCVSLRTGIRRLTPLECERLQGFPDGWTDVPFRGRSAADGPRYKAIGNSWPVNVARWIGRRIELVEDVMCEIKKIDE